MKPGAPPTRGRDAIRVVVDAFSRAAALPLRDANFTIRRDGRPNQRMLIHLLVDPLRVWGWHARLAAGLQADGHEVRVRLVEGTRRRALPTGYALLEWLERFTARGAPLRFANRLSPADLPPPASDVACDLLLDVSGSFQPGDVHAVGLVSDAGDDGGLMAALCERRAPTIALMTSDGRTLADARPATERPESLTRSLEFVFARACSLARSAPRLFSAASRAPQMEKAAAASGMFALSAARLAASAIAAKLQRFVRAAPRWRAGYRMTDDDRVIDRLRWPASSYIPIPDDGTRFYADPFIVAHEGRRFIFVEDYPFATNKGVISYVALDEVGRASAPRPALERPCHLSYPMIFQRDGAIWMIPETSGARTIELYRADPFPDRWTLARVLVEDVIASDMTLLDHGGRLWLLGTITDEGASTWDALGLFSADSLFGEWRAHPANPALIDASCARPAGFCAQTGAGLIRPAQDCRGGYGAAIAFARIDRLDEEAFEQTIIARLRPDPRWNAAGAHTVNAAAGLEAIDWIA
ncbi:MAG: hypothetical protein BGP06_17860 [Rhizobiales bacterium 65-9]|nr:MAG: hypothetical protein BGP06_17860 [Rhizobiales bacterium 65-9]